MGQASLNVTLIDALHPGRKPWQCQQQQQPSHPLSPPCRPPKRSLLQYCTSFPLNVKYSRQQVTKQFSYSKTQNKNTTWAKVSTRHTQLVQLVGSLAVTTGAFSKARSTMLLAVGGKAGPPSERPVLSSRDWSTPRPSPGIRPGGGTPQDGSPTLASQAAKPPPQEAPAGHLQNVMETGFMWQNQPAKLGGI